MTTTPKHMAIAEAILHADHVRALEATEHLDLEPYDREQVRNALRCSCVAEPDSHHRRIGQVAVKARDAAKARRVVDLDAMDAALRKAMSVMTRALTQIEHDSGCDARAVAAAAMRGATEAMEDATPSDAERGREAEELRSGVERIMDDAPRADRQIVAKLQALLDRVDARDSLAFLERSDAPRWAPLTHTGFAAAQSYSDPPPPPPSSLPPVRVKRDGGGPPTPCLDPNKMNGAADQQWDDL